MDRWDQKGIPHKGWTCEGVTDLDAPDGHCEMCGREEVRYIHHMSHPDYPVGLDVGCVCADKMEDDRVAPRLRERVLRNAATRRKRWLSRAWRISRQGNEYINTDGFNISVFPKVGGGWGGKIEERATGRSVFNRRHYRTSDEAKLGAFDGMVFLKNSRGWGL
jgi:hypothetical protein